MAYVAPSTRTTGTLITAAIWNQDAVANPIALYAGALSIASQAAYDVFYAASATQLGRIALGQGVMYHATGAGSAPGWSMAPALTTVTASAGMAVAAGQKMWFDGVAMTGDTYIYESAANVLDAFAGGSRLWFGYAGFFELGTGRELIVHATKKIYFDGGGNTHISETSADQLDLVVGGVRGWVVYGGGVEIGSTCDLIIHATKKLILDGGGDTAIWESSANNIRAQAGGSGGVDLTSGATAWSAVSDERSKTDFRNIVNASDMIAGWRTVTGRYHTDEPAKRRAFLIAQDVMRGLPEAVTEVEGELKLAYTDTIPVLAAALNEHTQRLTALEGARC